MRPRRDISTQGHSDSDSDSPRPRPRHSDSHSHGKRWAGICLVALGALVWVPAWAAEAPPTWNALSPSQQQQLAPLRKEWASIDAVRKQKWLSLVGRFAQMPPDERSRIQQRMAEWARLPAADRSHARQQFQEASKLSTDERQARWLEYQALSAEDRQQLTDQAQHRQRLLREQPVAADDPAARNASRAKTNVLPLRDTPHTPTVAPAIVQAKPGATTNTVARPPQPARFQQAGLPKIAATPEFVNPTTMQPRRGAQAAATVAPHAARPPPSAASSATE